MSTDVVVQSGKYKFRIIRNIQKYEDQIITHTYKLGGDYNDCVNISYFYNNNIPIKAKIPHLLYEPECAIDSNLERGGGTELMIKTAIQYAFSQVKTITKFEFDDNSHIDCVEKNMTLPPPRHPIKPLNLAYFMIAYHGMTWYEARFNAEMIDNKKYKLYRKKIEFLTDSKEKPSFKEFLSIIGNFLNSTEIIPYLEKLYNKTTTYRDFFDAIPKSKRCDILYFWLTPFMNYYLGSVYSDRDWFIDVTKMNENHNSLSGGYKYKGKEYKYRIFSYKTKHNL